MEFDRQRLTRLGSAFGFALSLGAVVYIAVLLVRPSTWEAFRAGVGVGVPAGVGLVGLIVAGNVLLAIAWYLLVSERDQHLSLPAHIHLYAVSFIARYLPGNIFHVGARHLLGRSGGVSRRALIEATLWEIGTISVAALPFVVAVLVSSHGSAIAVAALAATLAVILGATMTSVRRHRRLSLVVLLYTGFHFISSFVFLMVLVAASPHSADSPPTMVILGAYVMAWLIGLLTPGSPAGLGVREIVLLTWLRGDLASETLLVALTATRVITTVGDLAFGGVGIALKRSSAGAAGAPGSGVD